MVRFGRTVSSRLTKHLIVEKLHVRAQNGGDRGQNFGMLQQCTEQRVVDYEIGDLSNHQSSVDVSERTVGMFGLKMDKLLGKGDAAV